MRFCFLCSVVVLLGLAAAPADACHRKSGRPGNAEVVRDACTGRTFIVERQGLFGRRETVREIQVVVPARPRPEQLPPPCETPKVPEKPPEAPRSK